MRVVSMAWWLCGQAGGLARIPRSSSVLSMDPLSDTGCSIRFTGNTPVTLLGEAIMLKTVCRRAVTESTVLCFLRGFPQCASITAPTPHASQLKAIRCP